jgi:hypothetical protein
MSINWRRLGVKNSMKQRVAVWMALAALTGGAACVVGAQAGWAQDAGAAKATQLSAHAGTFEAYLPEVGFKLPAIVLQFDAQAGTGAEWGKVKGPKWHEASDAVVLGRAANYLREGLTRMTGKPFEIVSGNDLSKGIVLTLYQNASEEIKNDAAVKKTLAGDAKDPYAAAEAFYVRSEKGRVLVVANTPSGLTDGVVELLESVDYEVLGMGPDWTHVPDYRSKALVFNVEKAGRPSYYIRQLWAHSAQGNGAGTILNGVSDPADETVDVSAWRWWLGTRMFGKSMPAFPGHALQAYHKRVMDKMRATGSTEGFHAVVKMGLDEARPDASAELKYVVWMNTDAKGSPGFDQVFTCDGKDWKRDATPLYMDANLDVSAPVVREVIFEELKKVSEEAFKARPDERVIFGVDPEDGGVNDEERLRTIAHKNWYPEYLAKEKLPFGRPYALHGFKGIDQPVETWDPSSASDGVYGLASYLLHEYDKWIDSLPEAERVTSTGKSKKQGLRMSLQSYNYHDVPPNFNPDTRVRATIAPFPKHRGRGKWAELKTPIDVAAALKLMLPDEPSGNYFFYSFSYYNDGGAEGIPPRWSPSPAAIAKTYRDMYDAGFRSVGVEIDFNFGKYGPGYYLAGKALWDVSLGEQGLDRLRDRWLQRAYGSAWKEMKAYHDFMLPENYPVNSPNTWGKAVRLIDAADKKIDPAVEPDAKKRIDDVKEYWYSHYLFDTEKFKKDAPQVKEYLWKGQMSYMVGMQGLLSREYKQRDVKASVGEEISQGPAHYTREETAKWWPELLAQWPVVEVAEFAQATLANGKPAAGVDLNDLVMVKEFSAKGWADGPFLYNSGYQKPGTFLQVATEKGAELGFRMSWPFNPKDNYYVAKKVPYGVEIWDAAEKAWMPWIDKAVTSQQSVEVRGSKGNLLQVVDVKLEAPRAGTYRFTLGYGGNLSLLGSRDMDPLTGTVAGDAKTPFTYYNQAVGLTQSGVWIYIPKGTKTLDLDVWDTAKAKTVSLYKGLPSLDMKMSRKVDIGAMGVNRVALEAGEDGSLALIHGNGFAFPLLYSVPSLWAKAPGALLVPRAVAEADGLTVVGGGK